MAPTEAYRLTQSQDHDKPEQVGLIHPNEPENFGIFFPAQIRAECSPDDRVGTIEVHGKHNHLQVISIDRFGNGSVVPEETIRFADEQMILVQNKETGESLLFFHRNPQVLAYAHHVRKD